MREIFPPGRWLLLGLRLLQARGPQPELENRAPLPQTGYPQYGFFLPLDPSIPLPVWQTGLFQKVWMKQAGQVLRNPYSRDPGKFPGRKARRPGMWWASLWLF